VQGVNRTNTSLSVDQAQEEEQSVRRAMGEHLDSVHKLRRKSVGVSRAQGIIRRNKGLSHFVFE
jgi:hypothetical protein